MKNFRLNKEFDFGLVFLVLVIFILGLFFLYSASYQKSLSISKNFTLMQLLWMGLSIVFFFVILIVGYQHLLDWAYIFYIFGIIFLAAVLIFAPMRYGARRWFDIGPLTIQPSELAKLIVIITLARYLGQRNFKINNIFSLAVSFIIVAVPAVLIFKEPDLGSALLLFPVLLVMLYAAGIRYRYLFYILATAILSSPLIWHILKDYQKKRLLVFLNPNLDPLGAGYTIIQSKIAIGSGGLLGKGWLSGTQNQLNFLPERHTDFIFSVVGEEWGFAGTAILVLLYFWLLKKMLNIVFLTQDIYARLLGIGIITMLWMQVVINIAMTLGLMPVVGITLPLISYGGSSLFITIVSVAIVLDINLRRKIF